MFLLSARQAGMLQARSETASPTPEFRPGTNERVQRFSKSCRRGCWNALVSSEQILCDRLYLVRLEAELSLKLF